MRGTTSSERISEIVRKEVPQQDRARDNRNLGVAYFQIAKDIDRALRTGFGWRRTGAGRWLVESAGPMDRDDLVQEVFVRAFSNQSTFDASRALGPYLMAIARNLYIDRLRKRRYRMVPLHNIGGEIATPSDDAAEIPDSGSADGLSAEACGRLERRVQIVGEYLLQLPPALKSVYDARFVRGLSQRDAASALQMTRRRVRTLEARLVAGAARELRDDGIFGKKEKRPKGRPRT